jgi:hypothetical protein
MRTLVHLKPSQFDLYVLGFNLYNINFSYHHICLRIDAMLECCFPFPVSFCFSPVGSGVDVSNESDVKINNTDDQYLSINEQVKKENLGYLLYLVINNKASSPPPPLNL